MTIDIDIDDSLLDDHINYLISKKKQIETEYDNVKNIRLNVYSYHDYYENYLTFERDETDQEFKSRISWQDSKVIKRKLEDKKKEEKDRKEYARLKKKYES